MRTLAAAAGVGAAAAVACARCALFLRLNRGPQIARGMKGNAQLEDSVQGKNLRPHFRVWGINGACGDRPRRQPAV